VKVHNSRRFSVGGINRVVAPPRTRVARAVVDAAAWSASPRRACAIVCAAVQQRLITAERLLVELHRAGAGRHLALLRALLWHIPGGGHTLTEIELGPLARRAGLLRRELNGPVCYVDLVSICPTAPCLPSRSTEPCTLNRSPAGTT